ncbi:phosphotransferase family protein [Streptomyces xanthophaeus]|uniref:phosphotransferase family protein n=1 Tax=Streptomyces xanthophaeus TaxID=67385 RepID=UPI002648DC53|nr:phosphotransferase family protein [Streptomyces xanthophaeus]WKD32287.1 phosphotransferase family protein [Streptomyces xanthophaeus]
MPVPLQRDPDLTRAVLTHWFGTRSADIGEVQLGPVTVPKEVGFSGEILLLDARWTEGGRAVSAPLAIRVAPTNHRVFPEDHWQDQVRVLKLLGDTALPVPSVRWDEPSDSYLGAPFVVMDRVDGQVPADLPSYHRQGWLAELTPGNRETAWNAGVDLLAQVHRTDLSTGAFAFLDRAEHGPVGSGRLLRHLVSHLQFYGIGANPAAHRALDWLTANLPADEGPPTLLWGDARLGNIIYDGLRPAALLDWELTGLGPPEADLAWFLHLDRHLSEGIGASRLPGLPERARTVARWEEGTGRRAEHLAWHEVFAAFRFCVMTARVTRLLGESGILLPGTEVPLHRNATTLLATVLDEAGAPAAHAASRSGGPVLHHAGRGWPYTGGEADDGRR